MAIKPTVSRKVVGSKEKKQAKKAKQRTSGPAMTLRQKQEIIRQMQPATNKIVEVKERVEGMPMRIAKAADTEGMFEKDVLKFSDLVSKHQLEGWEVEDLKDAQRINSTRIRKLDVLFEGIRRRYYGMDDQDQMSGRVVKKRNRMPEFFVAVKPVATAKMRVGRKFV